MIFIFFINSKIDEELTAKINLADCIFSFASRDKLYSPAWIAPEGCNF